jgi:predicted RNase H-like nuclease (RuvC/YqgF family)
VSPTPTIPAEPAPQAIDYTFLIEKAVEKATAYADKMIATLEKQVAILEKDVETKDREISILKARLHEFEIATTIITPGQKYPFEVGVSEAKDQPSAKI